MHELTFCFLVFRRGPLWRAHSVNTGQVAEGRTAEDAETNLTKAIDLALHMADTLHISPKEWFESQVVDESKYVRMFLEATSAERKETRQVGGVVVLARIQQAA